MAKRKAKTKRKTVKKKQAAKTVKRKSQQTVAPKDLEILQKLARGSHVVDGDDFLRMFRKHASRDYSVGDILSVIGDKLDKHIHADLKAITEAEPAPKKVEPPEPQPKAAPDPVPECAYGHYLEGDNAIKDDDGYIRCRSCQRDKATAYEQERKAAVNGFRMLNPTLKLSTEVDQATAEQIKQRCRFLGVDPSDWLKQIIRFELTEVPF